MENGSSQFQHACFATLIGTCPKLLYKLLYFLSCLCSKRLAIGICQLSNTCIFDKWSSTNLMRDKGIGKYASSSFKDFHRSLLARCRPFHSFANGHGCFLNECQSSPHGIGIIGWQSNEHGETLHLA
jgi:hypothetical protein